jgi:3-deoxy-D-manno-octulosonic-acid transferase
MAGDTRYDRVKGRMDNVEIHPAISEFSKNSKVIVFGSTWKDDLDVVLPFINASDEKMIIAPHNIGRAEVDFIVSSITQKTLRFTEINESTAVSDYQVLVIDNIGMLASVYSLGKIAYVGGAFHGSLHNILEPAVFGIPVIFGPHHSKFPEAKAMINAGCGFEISNAEEFSERMDQFKSAEVLNRAGQKADEFVRSNLGSSKVIVEGISSLIQNRRQ